MTRERGNLSGGGNKEFQEKGVDFLGQNSADKLEMIGGFDEKGGRSSGLQELTLSYLCENSKLGFPGKDISGKILMSSVEKMSSSYKGKEIFVSEDPIEDNNVWVERDFLRLGENRGNTSKREAENAESEGENREKKPKVESLDLSLALPDVSHFMTESNRFPNVDFPRPAVSVQSVAPSSDNDAQTTFFTSYSYPHPVSHNPSCSLTRNSTENYDYSMGSHRRECDQIWNCGEGTNGSVHSRFRPMGDGTVALLNHEVGMGNRCGFSKNLGNNSFNRTTSSENLSFFPSDLPARPRMDGQSGDLRQDIVAGRASKLSMSERIVREIVFESIPVMAQIMQELTDETIDSVKDYLKDVISKPERQDELVDLQKKLERRSDLTNETLSKCQTSQLEILVAIKTEIGDFLNGKNLLPRSELVEIFLLERCRNVNCKRLLPVDDCECKICSTQKGFCSECMCPICLNFDCANKTCSWVGCDVCSHWCHAACGLQRNIIKPGPSLKRTSGITEMQFYCLGCDHASEMFGFIKEVFLSFAKEWSIGTLIKELDYVREIFRGSEDVKGKELHVKANEMLSKLESKIITAPDACNLISQFFLYADGLSDLGSSSLPSKTFCNQESFDKAAASLPPSNSLTPKTPFYNRSDSSGRQELAPFDLHQNDITLSIMGSKILEDEWSVKHTRKDGLESLESLMRVKEAEARMFQNRADEAQRDAESFRRMVRIKVEKLEEEYSEKLAKLCLPETEERQRKKMEELKELENSHCDYYKMKMRMQSEIAGLLKRMEATKQQVVKM